jgi:hypothetical protein
MHENIQKVKGYFKEHWVAMVFGAVPMFLVALVSLVNILIAFRVDYAELKTTVQANANETHNLESALQAGQVTQNASIKQLLQAHSDEEVQLTQMESQVNSIYGYLLPIK